MSDDKIKVLTIDDILRAKDITVVPVDVPEWGGRVYVRSMSALQRERFNTEIRKLSAGKPAEFTKEQTNGALVQFSLCDEYGVPLSTDPSHVAALMDKNSDAMQRVVDASAVLNNLSGDTSEVSKNALPGMKVNGSVLSLTSPDSSDERTSNSSVN